MIRFLAVAALLIAIPFARAEEREGLCVEIVPNIAADRSEKPGSTQSLQAKVDKDMSLKATVKNVSMKELPEGSIEYVILVSRWTADEKEKISRYTGTEKLPGLKPAEQVEVAVGQYQIGGHRHGTSSRHEDKLAGWKLVATPAGRRIEFRTPSSFEAMSNSAQSAR